MELSFSISSSNEYSWLISFRIDWLDLLAFQETLKTLFLHHNLKASVLQPSAFFMIQLSHSHMTTGKTIVLTIQTFIGKIMLFKKLSRSVMAFLLRSKCFEFHSVMPSRFMHVVANDKISLFFKYISLYRCSGNSDRLYFGGLQNHCRWWLQPRN